MLTDLIWMFLLPSIITSMAKLYILKNHKDANLKTYLIETNTDTSNSFNGINNSSRNETQTQNDDFTDCLINCHLNEKPPTMPPGIHPPALPGINGILQSVIPEPTGTIGLQAPTTVSTTTTEGCFTEPDFDYRYFDLQFPVRQVDWKACRASAKGVANAHFWTFRIPEGLCWLKTSNINRIAEGRGVLISGNAGCREAPTTVSATITEANTTVSTTTTKAPTTALATTTEAPTTVSATITEANTTVSTTTTKAPTTASATTTEAPTTVSATTTEGNNNGIDGGVESKENSSTKESGAPLCAEDNIVYVGKDIIDTGKRVSNEQECHKYCEEVSECEVWVYYKKRTTCQLKTYYDYLLKKNNNEYASGQKNCSKGINNLSRNETQTQNDDYTFNFLMRNPFRPPPTGLHATPKPTGTIGLQEQPTLPASGEWLKIFKQSLPGDFFAAGEWNKGDISQPTFSNLQNLEKYRSIDGSFHFYLWYPELEKGNEWIQTSNPVTKTSRGVDGYKALNISFETRHWGGLEYNNVYSLLDGSANHFTWFYAIGSFNEWFGGIPGPNGAVKKVELYIDAKGSGGESSGSVSGSEEVSSGSGSGSEEDNLGSNSGSAEDNSGYSSGSGEVSSGPATITSICSTSDSQFYPHHTDCQKFYHCFTGRAPFLQSCPNGTGWSIQLKTCDRGICPKKAPTTVSATTTEAPTTVSANTTKAPTTVSANTTEVCVDFGTPPDEGCKCLIQDEEICFSPNICISGACRSAIQ